MNYYLSKTLIHFPKSNLTTSPSSKTLISFPIRFCNFAKIMAVKLLHYTDVRMGAMGSQITSLTIVYSTVYSGADQRNHQSCASLAFVRGIHRGPVNSPHKGPVTRKMFPFDDVIICALDKSSRWLCQSPCVLCYRNNRCRAIDI